jgi:hypothetical protein
MLFFSGSFIAGSHVCIVPEFLNIPAQRATDTWIDVDPSAELPPDVFCLVF